VRDSTRAKGAELQRCTGIAFKVERRSQGAVIEIVAHNHELAEKGHLRLRKDVDALDIQVERMEAAHAALLARLTRIEQSPVNVEKVSWSTRQMIVIFGAGLSIAAGMWQLRVGIDAVNTTVANAARLQDERNATQKETLDNLGRQIEMRRVEIQRVRDDLAEFTRQRQK
jgi:hypothetical protein